jgi:hypothetical protein
MEGTIQTHPDIHYDKQKSIVGPSSYPRKRRRLKRAPEPLGILVIHASAVHVDGKAVVFLGPCGTGKSTVCNLLSAKQQQSLADDKVYLIPQQEHKVWVVADASERAFLGPLSKQEGATLQGPILQAVIRLYQDSQPNLECIDTATTFCHLTNAFFEIAWNQRLDTAWKKQACASLAEIGRAVLGYHLHFNLSQLTSKLLNEVIQL